MNKFKLNLVAAIVAIVISGCASTTGDNVTGENRKQILFVSEDAVINSAIAFHNQERNNAKIRNKLIESGQEYLRLKAILDRMIPQVAVFRPSAASWKWELSLIESEEVNAYVLAGGKITFFTGIIKKLALSDDEIAAIMGHEIAHALREHTREKLSTAQITDNIINVGTAMLGLGSLGSQAAQMAKNIGLDLPFSRVMESEADAYGLELSARSGYNPRGAVTFWEKMEKNSPSESLGSIFSTHPSNTERRTELQKMVPLVQPFYEKYLTENRTNTIKHSGSGINSKLITPDRRVESTGLLGKTLSPKKKFSKNWNGELPYFNNYASFPGNGVVGIPDKTNIIMLVPEKANKKKAIFAYVKENDSSSYFVDVLEVDVPKGYTAQYWGCTVGHIGLFKNATSESSPYSSPIKAWSVVDERFRSILNFSKMQCEDVSIGD